MIIKYDMTDSEIAETLNNVEKSLHDQQENLWKRIDILNKEYLNADKSKKTTITDDYFYHKKLSDLVSDIRCMRSLELLLANLLCNDDWRSFDEHVLDTAKIYCRRV